MSARICRLGTKDFFSHSFVCEGAGEIFSTPFASFWMIGIANAAVFPVPVCAQPRRSNPQRTIGIAFSWIGVGVVYPSSSRAFRIGGMSWSSEKSMRNGMKKYRPHSTREERKSELFS